MKRLLIIIFTVASLASFGQTPKKWDDQITYTAAGTNTYTVTITGYTYYKAGHEVKILFTNANSGTSTLQIGALAAIPIRKNGSTPLASGDIAAGSTYLLSYDGTNFQVLNIAGSGGGSDKQNKLLLDTDLSSLFPLMDAWYDGHVETGKLIDKSGNNLDATLTSNLVTDGDAELNSTLDTFLGVPTSISKSSSNVDARPGSTGTRCFNVQVVGAVANTGIKTKPFVTIAGETINYSFWIKRITNITLTWGIKDGADVTNVYTSNSVSTPLSLGTWVNITGSFVAPVSGGRTHLWVIGAVASGDFDFRLDDIDISVNGQTNNCFKLPINAALQAADEMDHFYSETDVPRSVRADWEYNAYVRRIYCGGAFKYIFLKANPTPVTDYIISKRFEDLDFAWKSSPVVITAGSGKTYANIQTAIAASTGTATFLHRRRIEVYSSEYVDTYSNYSVTTAFGRCYIQMNREFDLLDGIGDITIEGTKLVTSSDSELTNTELFTMIFNGTGVRNIKFKKSNGGYFWHEDFTVGSDRRTKLVKDCDFEDYGGDAVYAYRTANALPAPVGTLTQRNLAVGFQNNLFLKISNTRLSGLRPATWQDAVIGVGEGGAFYLRDCVLESKILYDAIENPTSVLLGVRLVSTGLGNSQVYFSGTTRNEAVLKVGSTESIFLTEIEPYDVVKGSGQINELAYWEKPNVLSSLSTGIYPSLPEISFVKGVRSNIQTQIDAALVNPMTTGGDIIYGGVSGVATRLANGTSTHVLTSNGGTAAPSWQAIPATPAWLLGGSYNLTSANTIGGNFNVGFSSTSNQIGFGYAPGSITANTKVEIRGTDNLGTSFGLRVNNNSGTNLMHVTNVGGLFTLGASGIGAAIVANNVLSVGITQGQTSGTTNGITYTGTFNPSSGTAIHSNYRAGNIINQAVGATGATYGFIAEQSIFAAENYTGVYINPATPANIRGTNRAVHSTSGDWLMQGSGTSLTLGNGATASQLRWLEPSAGGSQYVSIEAPALAANNTYILPNAYPSVSGQVLSSTNTGTMSWVSAGGGGGISNTAAADELMKSDGTNSVPSGIFSPTAGSLTMGTGLSGGRNILVASTDTDASLILQSKNLGDVLLSMGSGTSNNQTSFVLGQSSARATRFSSATSSVIDVFDVYGNTTGTPAVGIGTGLRLYTQTAPSVSKNGVSIDAVSTNITTSSESFDAVFRTMLNNVPTERLRISSNGALGLSGTNYGTSGQVLTSQGTAAPIWTTPTTKANNWVDNLSSTATAAGTTTLTVSSNKHQVFTGATTQTMVLPDATTLTVGHLFIVHNQSSGVVTVQTNGGATIRLIAGGFDAEFVCTSIGTAAGTWEIQANVNAATGKGLTVNNSLTLAGTDGTTMTFPSTSATIARTDAANTFTGVQTMTSPSIATSIVNTGTTFTAFNTVATTFSTGGAATTLNIGGTPTSAITHNYSANATATATTKTVNLGTAGAAGSTTNVNIGSATASAVLGTLTLGFPTIVQPANHTTLNLFNTQTTTLNVGGAATTVSLGAATGTATINNVTTAMKHIDGTTAAPGIAAGVGAGTTPTVSMGTNSNDISGIINVTTGTTPTGTNAIVATITFNTAYVTAPFVTLTPANRNAQALTGATVVLVPAAGQTNGVTTTTFVIESGATALAASTAYIWYYQVIQ